MAGPSITLPDTFWVTYYAATDEWRFEDAAPGNGGVVYYAKTGGATVAGTYGAVNGQDPGGTVS